MGIEMWRKYVMKICNEKCNKHVWHFGQQNSNISVIKSPIMDPLKNKSCVLQSRFLKICNMDMHCVTNVWIHRYSLPYICTPTNKYIIYVYRGILIPNCGQRLHLPLKWLSHGIKIKVFVTILSEWYIPPICIYLIVIYQIHVICAKSCENPKHKTVTKYHENVTFWCAKSQNTKMLHKCVHNEMSQNVTKNVTKMLRFGV